MRKDLLMTLLLAFNKDKNCLMAFEIATAHLSDEEFQKGIQKCLATHTKSTLVPAELNKYALSERINNARNTLLHASRSIWGFTQMITFSDLALCTLVERHGGLEYFSNQDEEYFFGDWGIKSFSDKYLEIATSEVKKYKRYIYNEKQALKNANSLEPVMCYIYDKNSAIKRINYEDAQLVLRSEEEKQRYLQEEKERKNLAKLFQTKVII